MTMNDHEQTIIDLHIMKGLDNLTPLAITTLDTAINLLKHCSQNHYKKRGTQEVKSLKKARTSARNGKKNQSKTMLEAVKESYQKNRTDHEIWRDKE